MSKAEEVLNEHLCPDCEETYVASSWDDEDSVYCCDGTPYDLEADLYSAEYATGEIGNEGYLESVHRAIAEVERKRELCAAVSKRGQDQTGAA
ncbi:MULTISPECIES: hypothetical protein [unclassified Cryobacterium]|uniref:hypothetical protein n=1 Tax=unclassified Cryobacterium TaxID=2649013 RepID=UPI002B23DC43|nr:MULTISPECIES: hypothetical protein [Cryobacterium]MEB0303867.1 hypothetical protein [Cryobacterium sp. 10I1]MEC5148744.1 hypothetical protein [Cryobacterium psychrotolerans]